MMNETLERECRCGNARQAKEADRLAVLLDEQRTRGRVTLSSDLASQIQVALEDAAGAHRSACDCASPSGSPVAASSFGEPVSQEAAVTDEIRRQRNAWRDYAEHLDHCRECSEMGSIGDCFERKELEEATKCTRCGGSARLLPDVECHICAEPRP